MARQHGGWSLIGQSNCFPGLEGRYASKQQKRKMISASLLVLASYVYNSRGWSWIGQSLTVYQAKGDGHAWLGRSENERWFLYCFVVVVTPRVFHSYVCLAYILNNLFANRISFNDPTIYSKRFPNSKTRPRLRTNADIWPQTTKNLHMTECKHRLCVRKSKPSLSTLWASYDIHSQNTFKQTWFLRCYSRFHCLQADAFLFQHERLHRQKQWNWPFHFVPLQLLFTDDPLATSFEISWFAYSQFVYTRKFDISPNQIISYCLQPAKISVILFCLL